MDIDGFLMDFDGQFGRKTWKTDNGNVLQRLDER